MSIGSFYFLLLSNGASGPIVKIHGFRAGVWELIIVDGGHHYPSGIKHGAGRGHGRQAHDTYMTWPYFRVVTCAGRGPWWWSSPWAHCDHNWLPGPGIHNTLHHQDLGPGVQKKEEQYQVYYHQQSPGHAQCHHLPLTICREATPCPLIGKCKSRWTFSYRSTESPEIPEKTMQPRREETEISHGCPKNLSTEIATFKEERWLNWFLSFSSFLQIKSNLLYKRWISFENKHHNKF